MRRSEDPCRDPASEARDDWEEREDAIRFSSVNRELAAKVARLERELEQERQLADRLALELRWRVAAGGHGAEQGREALDAWKAARNEAVNPP